MPVYGSHRMSYQDLQIGRRLREFRLRSGVSLRDLSRAVNISTGMLSYISTGMLSYIENDQRFLDIKQVSAIADALAVPVDSLVPEDRCVPYQIARADEPAAKVRKAERDDHEGFKSFAESECKRLSHRIASLSTARDPRGPKASLETS